MVAQAAGSRELSWRGAKRGAVAVPTRHTRQPCSGCAARDRRGEELEARRRAGARCPGGGQAVRKQNAANGERVRGGPCATGGRGVRSNFPRVNNLI